jgi:anti-sigma-K factor RskA
MLQVAALYVLGAGASPERTAFEAHLASCDECAAEVRALTPITEALARAVPPAEPAAAVRTDLLAHIEKRAKPQTKQPRVIQKQWQAAAALLVAVSLGLYAAQLRERVANLEKRLRQATALANDGDRQIALARRTATEAQLAVAVLAAPDRARIDLAGQPAAPRASAQAFWSRSRGLVFTASDLPRLPAGRVLQLWVLTVQPEPISAALLTPDENGRVNAVISTPPDLPQPVAMAVTLELEGGVPRPSGDKYLVGLVR